jgi:carboxypeptidase family protein/TonB-dependent receptor-like protein
MEVFMLAQRRVLCLTVLLGLVILMTPALVSAQAAQVGDLSGVIKDSSGAAVPGASVVATSQERGFSRRAVSDSAGRFRFPAIGIGAYRVVVSLTGFDTVTLTDNLVESERTTELNVSMKVQTQVETITVTGEAPIVDMTNSAVSTKVRAEEFQRLPMGRSYQALMGQAPGVLGTGNVNAHGALTSNNLFLFDGVNSTDPTTGTFGSNLTFEGIQEVTIYTSAVSAEYGRAVGAITNVITKTGTNRYEGSAKYLLTNDKWNTQNSTKSEVNGASLERTKLDIKNPVYAFTLGGPVWKDHAWFFANYERAKTTGAQTQTAGGQNYQQTVTSPFFLGRLTAQLSQNHTIWARYLTSPSNGFIVNYWGQGGAADLSALTGQDQTAKSVAVQWTGVLRSNWSADAFVAQNWETIDVGVYQDSSLTNGSPHFSLADNRWYNGPTFIGAVDRPRKQATISTTYYTNIGNNSHSFKAGFDIQQLESSNAFIFANNQRFIDNSFNITTRAFSPSAREDYQSGDSRSKGTTYALYARDKFELGKRLFVEAGLRYEKQTGDSDVGASTIDTATIAPRLSGSFDLRGNGKSLIVGSYGRFYQSILQGFSDNFANIPQQTNYDNYVWNGSTYVFSNSIRSSASTFKPNLDLKPTFVDEATAGFQQQVGRVYGFGARFIYRKWGNLIDDVRSFNPDNTLRREVVNYAAAEHKYVGFELSFEKRFSHNWNAAANYTYSKASGNHFADNFTTLGDYLDARCRTTVDTTIGTGGIVPCRDAAEGNRNNLSGFDRPHNFKANGAYSVNFGRTNLVVSGVGNLISKTNFTKNRTLNVLLPGTTTNAGPTLGYFYEPAGSERLPGMIFTMDNAMELTFRTVSRAQFGFKAEAFNTLNNQEKSGVNSTLWCNDTSGTNATCVANRNTFALAAVRGNFIGPRTYRFTALVRF